MSNSLASGTYTITSHATNSPIGRPLVEDKSALPKRVVMLSDEAEAPKVSPLHLTSFTLCQSY